MNIEPQPRREPKSPGVLFCVLAAGGVHCDRALVQELFNSGTRQSVNKGDLQMFALCVRPKSFSPFFLVPSYHRGVAASV